MAGEQTTQTPEGGAQNGGAGEKTLTLKQSELDAMFKPRTEEARRKAQQELLESLGVKDADELKTALSKAKELEQAQLTEAEQLKQKVADAEAAKQETERKAQERMARANEKLIRSALVAAASDRFQDPADVWLYVSQDKTLREALKLTDTDDVEGIKDVLDKVAEQKKHWLKQPSSPRIGTPGAGTRTTPPKPPANADPVAAHMDKTYPAPKAQTQ